ncbi:DUF4113 domain-containing protein [Comamonas piscis]
MPLLRSTSDTALSVRSDVEGLKRIYKERYELVEARVILLDISDGTIHQSELDLGKNSTDRNAHYGALDKINMRYWRGTLHLASTGRGCGNARWGLRREQCSSRCTININMISTARCKVSLDTRGFDHVSI